jgi:heme exporter protein C
VWDARLTSELILLFLYLGYIALVEAIDDPPGRPGRRAAGPGGRGERAHHLLFGQVVEHAAPGRHHQHDGGAQDGQHTMLTAMLLMTFACWAYAFAVVFHAHTRHHPRTRARHRLGGPSWPAEKGFDHALEQCPLSFSPWGLRALCLGSYGVTAC